MAADLPQFFVEARRLPLLAIVAAASCSTPKPAPPFEQNRPTAAVPAFIADNAWRSAYDLDGDGTNDQIVDEFTGGGHCCYRIGAQLSSTGATTVLPFEMDGGYVRGLDFSRPEHFTVRTRAGGLPEIVYEIDTYNGEQQPHEPEQMTRWGIRSHHVALCFAGGKVRVRDDGPKLSPCVRRTGAKRR